MKTYTKTKNCEIDGIKDIPDKWKTKRLKFTIFFDNSTVDRHTHDDETNVSICHYPQVYKNEIISSKTEMENGTCTKKELDKFQLKKDDILITKDSETPDEIGVPAYIQEKIENAVSGYHIAHLTTNKNEILGNFLFRYLQSNVVNGYFETEANGVTRFGLGKDSISNLKLILPSITEQEKISRFLDRKTTKIDSDIQKNQKLIKLLKEKRQSIINQAVTKGLDDSVSLQESEIERIGNFPKLWGLNKIKFVATVKGRIGWQGLRTEEFIDIGPYLITGTDFQEGRINWKSCNHVEDWRFEQDVNIQIKEKDILITKDGTIGKIAYVDHLPDKTTLNSGVMVIRPKNKKFEPSYLFWLLKSNQFIDFIEMIKSGSTVQHLYQETFENFQFTLPDTSGEQKLIAKFLDDKINSIDEVLFMVSSQIKKLKELRQSLISSAVTGKIDVREIVA